jgi:hypothetical protein
MGESKCLLTSIHTNIYWKHKVKDDKLGNQGDVKIPVRTYKLIGL